MEQINALYDPYTEDDNLQPPGYERLASKLLGYGLASGGAAGVLHNSRELGAEVKDMLRQGHFSDRNMLSSHPRALRVLGRIGGALGSIPPAALGLGMVFDANARQDPMSYMYNELMGPELIQRYHGLPGPQG